MANFPTSVSTNANLYIAVNGLQTTLAASILATDTTIQLTSTSGFPTTGFVTIDNSEVVQYAGISGSNLTGCTRGADGTTAAPHNLGVTVGLTIVAAHHNFLKDEIIAIETALGAGFALPLSVANGGTGVTTKTGTVSVVLSDSPTLVTPNLGTPSAVVLTNATGLPLTTGVTGTLPDSNTTATPNATASTIVERDANINTKVNTLVENFSTTVTAAGTTALTVTSSPIQQFTGTTTQTVTLPDATTLSTGYQIQILNRSTGSVTVNNHGGSLQSTVTASTQATFTCTSTGSSNGTWDVSTSSAASGGTVTSVSGTTNQITSTNPTTTPVLALANPLTLPGAMTAGGNIAMASNKITGLANGTAASDAAAFGQIKYLQAPVQGTKTTSFSTTSSTFQATGLSASITPTSSSNRIKITAAFILQTSSPATADANATIKRGSTNIGSSEGFAFADTTGQITASICYIDSPATTSSTTYEIYLKNDNNVATVTLGQSNVTGTIILEEVV